MRKLVLAFATLLSAPTAALACSCLNTDDPAQLQQFAQEAAKGAVALAEVETIRDYDPARAIGEEVRITRTLAGTAQGSFTIERGASPSSASCDDLLQAGQKKVLILYPAAGTASQGAAYRVSNLCTNLLLEKPLFRDAVKANMAVGERG